jgi:hypothetical protein
MVVKATESTPERPAPTVNLTVNPRISPVVTLTPLPSITLTAPPDKQSVLESGPLRVHPENPRYLIDGTEKTILLVGSHHWDNLVDNNARPGIFDYAGYLDFLGEHNHNFMRMWAQVAWVRDVDPMFYQRVGPESALDGKPKFDLKQFNQAYFDRLRSRVIEAGERGIYVSVMLFQGWSIEDKGEGNPWIHHPYNGANNINGINGDLNSNGEGEEIHTLDNTAVTALQEAYVKKVVDTVNDLDNVIYEIANESNGQSVAWQYHMVEFIHSYEQEKPKQHLVGITGSGGINNNDLFAGPAGWISPRPQGGYRENPPAADGSKVIIADTDHLFGIGGSRAWVWKSFLRGLHLAFMDDLGAEAWKEDVRQAMGNVLSYANRINLAAMKPHNNLASTRYCLANPSTNGAEYLIYLPEGGMVTVDLRATQVELYVEWFDPNKGMVVATSITTGGSHQTLTAPFNGDAVLYIFDSIHVQSK